MGYSHCTEQGPRQVLRMAVGLMDPNVHTGQSQGQESDPFEFFRFKIAS